MSLRVRIFIIVSIVVFIILGISLFLVVGKKGRPIPSQPDGSANGTVSPTNGQPVNGQAANGVPAGLPAKTATPLEAEKNGVVQLAKVFVERYGTYSSDNEFQNIKDVETLVTRSLWSTISAHLGSKPANQSFVGVTTKVIGAELARWSGAVATVELKTMRTEERNGSVSTRYQDAAVDLVKVNSVWLVDKLVWK